MKQNILFIILSLVSVLINGQEYNYKADIESPAENGFYKILLSPEITSKLNPEFYDIRLYDTNNIEVPYILHKESRINEQELFVEYEIIETQHFRRRAYTRIVIHNPDKTEIDNIVLRIQNADVKKGLKLNASNNNRDWYVLKDNYHYNSIYNSQNTSEIRVLNFPLSDYEYYELLIDDYFDKPINITEAGYYNRVRENGKYTEIESITYTIKDTLKETTITIPVKSYIDKISFEIDAPKYYYRQAEIYVKRKSISKKKEIVYNDYFKYFKLISNSGNIFGIDNYKADTIYINIKNNDNAMLSIKDIRIYQLNKYITTELNSENSYQLKYSDKEALRPNYDLKYFTDSIPHNLETIITKAPEKISKSDETAQAGNLNFRSYWLWISIVLIALLLSYMSFKMIKDGGGSEEL